MNELRILVVDDSAADAELTKVRLRGVGVVEHCATLASALARLADATRDHPSVVLLDLTLPDSQGIETLDRITAVRPPPVLVLSGDDDPAASRAALARGAAGFVKKGEMSGDRLARLVRQAAGEGAR
jgi:DNA-binding NarL/FixJ family response regulator